VEKKMVSKHYKMAMEAELQRWWERGFLPFGYAKRIPL